jgi:hypothetical protein
VSASDLVIVDNLQSLKPASRVRAVVGVPGSIPRQSRAVVLFEYRHKGAGAAKK